MKTKGLYLNFINYFKKFEKSNLTNNFQTTSKDFFTKSIFLFNENITSYQTCRSRKYLFRCR